MPNELSFAEAVEQLGPMFDEPALEDDDALRKDEGSGDPEGAEDALDAEDPEAEAGEGAPEGEVDEDEPEGQKYLTVLGTDGKAHRMHVDALLKNTMHAVKEDGATRHVAYQDLVAGYQRQSDYTRKTQAVAEKEAELAPFAELVAYTKKDPAFVEYVQSYFNTGGVPAYLMQAAMPDVTEAQLAMALEKGDDDLRKQAAAVLRARSQVRDIQRAVQQRRAAIDEERVRLQGVRKSTAKQKLTTLVTDYDAQAKSINDSLREYGFTDGELEDMDWRVQRLAYDALQHKRTVKAAADKRQAPAPRAPKSVRSTVSEATRSTTRMKAQIDRARKSDDLKDWAKVLEGVI